MIRVVSVALALAAALALPAAAQQQPSPQDQQARQQLEQDAKAWQEAYNKKDAHALAEMYAPDAVLSAGNHTATGREAIERSLETEFQQGPLANLVITVERAQSLGPDHSWATGTWRGDASMPMMAMMQGMMQGQGGPMMQGQGGPMMQGQGQGGPMMQGQGGRMMQGTSTPPGQGAQGATRPIEGHWVIIAERKDGQQPQILAHLSNMQMPAGACPMCGAGGTAAPQGNK